MYSNLDIKDQSFLEVKLNTPHGVVPMELGWPKEKLRIENEKLVQVLNYSNQHHTNPNKYGRGRKDYN